MPNRVARLWKPGAQPVYRAMGNYGGTYPQFPHSRVDNYGPSWVLPTPIQVIQRFIPSLITTLSTAKNRNITDEDAWLSPLSTPPITTTTTYINRRGAAQ